MVEMTEAANILNNATPRSLVILDEIGRGTSTYDGVSLAWAITEYLHDHVGCRTLFATHYHELAAAGRAAAADCGTTTCWCASGRTSIVFLHKIAAGSADKSYGIHVARLAGVPAEVLGRAQGGAGGAGDAPDGPAASRRRPRAGGDAANPSRSPVCSTA